MNIKLVKGIAATNGGSAYVAGEPPAGAGKVLNRVPDLARRRNDQCVSDAAKRSAPQAGSRSLAYRNRQEAAC